MTTPYSPEATARAIEKAEGYKVALPITGRPATRFYCFECDVARVSAEPCCWCGNSVEILPF